MSKDKTTNTPFGYFGSKKRIALKILQDLPPHNAWVEAFCGSAALTLAKEPAKIEVINDIDDQIYNLFRVLRNRPNELLRRISLTPYSRIELDLARLAGDSTSRIERARLFLIESMMAVNGVFGDDRGGFSYSLSYSRNNREARVNRWYNLPDRLYEVVERLKSVRVEKMDARKLLGHYIDRPATLVYLDPPYLTERTNGYEKDANDEAFHIELLNIANRARCMIFISGYQSRLYNSMLSSKAGWKKKLIRTTTKGTNGNSFERTEVIWMNKHFIDAQKSGRVPIRLSAQEKRLNKLNPSRGKTRKNVKVK